MALEEITIQLTAAEKLGTRGIYNELKARAGASSRLTFLDFIDFTLLFEQLHDAIIDNKVTPTSERGIVRATRLDRLTTYSTGE